MPQAPTSRGLSAPFWVAAATAAVSGMLIHSGMTSGDWHGVLITELQVLVVAFVTYLGLR